MHVTVTPEGEELKSEEPMKEKKKPAESGMDAIHESQIPKLVGSLFRGAESVPTELAPARVFAVSSVQQGEGVTTVSLLIARELAKHPERQTLLASTEELKRLSPTDLTDPEQCWEQDPLHRVWRIASVRPASSGGSSWESDPRFVRDLLQCFRDHFGAIVLDCGALLRSPDVPKLGHLVDGTIVVVEAGRSSKAQIEHGLQVISLAGSDFKGFVLNRRTYPIPERIFRWLRK